MRVARLLCACWSPLISSRRITLACGLGLLAWRAAAAQRPGAVLRDRAVEHVAGPRRGVGRQGSGQDLLFVLLQTCLGSELPEDQAFCF